MKSTELISALNWRYATKQFDTNKKISTEQLDTLLESLRLSASSFGLQPWKFVIVENPALRETLVGHSWGQRQIADASHLIVLCRQTVIDSAYVEKYVQSVADTRHAPTEALEGYKNMMVGFIEGANQSGSIDAWMKNQVYIALGNLLTSAALIGVDACPIEGFDPKKYDEVLGLKALGLASCVVCPIGYRSADDAYASLAKVRLSKTEAVVTI